MNSLVNKPLGYQTMQVRAEKLPVAERPGKDPLGKNTRVLDPTGKASLVATLLRALAAWPC